jgi:hypothetical protein
LEEQRTKLLRQLRVHAEQMGDKALRHYGLSADQMVLVNEFAENLRNVRFAHRRRAEGGGGEAPGNRLAPRLRRARWTFP